MNAAPFVILGLTCVGVAVAAPGLSALEHVADAPVATSNAWSVKQVAALKSDQWGSGETSIGRSGDGHFYADVVANGVASHMLVDTGSTVVALTGEDAQAMGIAWDAGDVKHVGQGASGPVYGFPVTLDSVRLGEVELSKVEAMVIPAGLRISLLGQSFLGRLDHVEMEPDKMVLGAE